MTYTRLGRWAMARLGSCGGALAAVGSLALTPPRTLRLEGRSYAEPTNEHTFLAGKSGARLRLRRSQEGAGAEEADDEKRQLVVAAGQLRSEKSVQQNTKRIIEFIEEAASKGVELLVLPEAAVTGYNESAVLGTSPKELRDAEELICTACRRHSLAVVVGTPHFDDGGCGYNSATLISPTGEVIGRQHKLQLVPPDRSWSCPGECLNVFQAHGVPMSILVCHDKRYPELVRLPVLAGARLICYLSCEAWHDDLPLPYPRSPRWSEERLEAELAVYKAQLQARAVENKVWMVKANTSGCREIPSRGSHGMSCVIDPTGIVRAEAGIFTEELIIFNIDMSIADALYARKSLNNDYFLSGWWQKGLRHVVVN